MTQKETALELIPQYENKISILKLQDRYLQRKVVTISDRSWQMTLGKVQAELKAAEDYLNFLNEICESSELESAGKEKQTDTSIKH